MVTERGWATFWQLQCLVEVDRCQDWDAAAIALGASRQVVQKAVQRLEEKLRTDLVTDRQGRPVIARRDAVDKALAILGGYQEFAESARGRREYWLRVDGDWAHVAQFLGPAIRHFEDDLAASDPPARVRVELARGFGERRPRAGAGLLDELREDGVVDLVVSRVERQPRRLGRIDQQALYDSVLVAAVDDGHPLLQQARADETTRRLLREHRAVPLDLVQGFRSATSPKGHFSRDLIDMAHSRHRPLRTELTSPEPSALVALGSADCVPVIPSDSYVNWDDQWPAVVDASDPDAPVVLGCRYAAYWRTAGIPTTLSALLPRFVQHLVAESDHLRARVAPWGGLAFDRSGDDRVTRYEAGRKVGAGRAGR